MSINNSMWIGVSGLNSFGSAIGVVSDNVANANTTAFKSSSVRFGDMVSSYYSTQSRDTDREGSGSAILGIATDFSDGPMISTGNWSDLALNGNGFFSVSANNQTYYTRDGSFHVDKNGYLVTSQGYEVLNTTGAPIQVEPTPATPTYTNFAVDATGTIYGTFITPPAAPAPGSDGAPVPLGQIRVSTFPNQDGLIREGSNLYSIGPEAGAAVHGTAASGPAGSILDYTIEGSNVDLAAEMVNMVIYQADYNANSKSVTTASNMIETVINMIR